MLCHGYRVSAIPVHFDRLAMHAQALATNQTGEIAMPETQPIACNHDGTELEGFLVRPEGAGPFPAVMVMHSALGLRHMVRETAERLARLGYLAVCTDMYGKGAATGTPAAAGSNYAALFADPERLRARTIAWFDAVTAHPLADPARIAAIGYCFGGKCVLELARSGADVKAVASYHGILTTHAAAEPGIIKGHVAAWCGLDDPYAPLDDIAALREELSAAGARYHVAEFSKVAHSFTDPDAAALGMPGIAYDAVADRVSWVGTLALLENVLA
jgi:dienelactone hydrolase